MKPRLLDLFCGAGGVAAGYHRAGFDVVGVDILAQPHFPFEFVQDDALGFLADVVVADPTWSGGFHVVHASPPCQFYSRLSAMHPTKEYPALIGDIRSLLVESGLPWVIENVEGAPLATRSDLFGAHGVMLCGSMFGLGVERGYLRRHRLFETSFPVAQPEYRHKGLAVGVYGHGGHSGKHRMLYRAEAAEAMQIDWMSRDEMTQVIPPAYTEYIGAQLIAHLGDRPKVKR